jgi:hypothetical protein
MRRLLLALAAALPLLLSGCLARPYLIEPALPPQPSPTVEVENPLYIPLSTTGDGYDKVFQRVLDVVDDYFEIAYANRYDGRIETYPRVAPGFEQLWKPGNPDSYGRLWATLQTIRHRCFILIQPADDGGFFVQVTVYRELEDLPKPTRSTAGAASFRSDNTVDRTYEVIDPAVFEPSWAPLGRDIPFEQSVLDKLKKCL